MVKKQIQRNAKKKLRRKRLYLLGVGKHFYFKKKFTITMSGRSYFGDDVPIVVLKNLFKKYDIDNNGLLSKFELEKLLKEDLGFSDEKTDAFHLLIDKNGDGTVSFDEFKDWVQSGEKFKFIDINSRYFIMMSAINLFAKYDKDNSRCLDRQEFMSLHNDFGGKSENADSALQVLDKDTNGVISFYEFLKWLNWVDFGLL